MRRIRMVSLSVWLTCFTALGAPGCAGSGDSSAGDVIVRDSAGVRIAESTPDTWPPPEIWRVADSPSVNIGVRDGDPDYQLHQVRSVVGLEDGGVVIAEFLSRLRYYDANGKHVRTLDRRGNGPGESRAISQMQRYRGDSLLLITDVMFSARSRTRMMLHAIDGTYGRIIDATYTGSGERGDGWSWSLLTDSGVQGVLADGSFVVEGSTRIDHTGFEGEVIFGRAALMRVDADGAVGDTVALVRTGAYTSTPSRQRKYELMAAEADRIPVRTRGMRFYSAFGDQFAVDVYEARPLAADGRERGPSARLVRSHRVHAALSPATEKSRSEYREQLVAAFGAGSPEEEKARYRARIDSLQAPKFQPAIQDVRIDAAGNIWLESYMSPGLMSRDYSRAKGISVESGPSRWIVLDDAGSLLGSVMIPEGLKVQEIGVDYVLGIWYDDFGVEYVRKYPLIKM